MEQHSRPRSRQSDQPVRRESHRPLAGLTKHVTALVACITATLAMATSASAQQLDQANYLKLEAEQNEANSRPGPRHVPSKVLSVPTTVSKEMQQVIAAPYPLPLWTGNHPKNADEWRKVTSELNARRIATLPALLKSLDVTMEQTVVGGVNAYVLTPKNIPDQNRGRVALYIHGGGFVYNAGEAGNAEAVVMAALGGFKVISVDYRMPPEHPYPAALDDVVSCYKGLLETYDNRRIAVFGTSAGGGLTLSLMLRAKAEGLPMPGAIAPGTPWSDLTEDGGGDSLRANEWLDGSLVGYRGYITDSARLYANGHDLKDPYLSPLQGDFRGFPPAIVTTGTRDLFLSLSALTHRKLRQAGVDARLQVFEGQSHAQYYVAPSAPETKDAYREIALFFDEHLAR